MSNPDLEEAIRLMNRRKKNKTEEYYINLQANEQVILRTAGSIYAAYLSSGRIPEGQEEAFMDSSIQAAAKMAMKVEKLVTDAEEKIGD